MKFIVRSRDEVGGVDLASGPDRAVFSTRCHACEAVLAGYSQGEAIWHLMNHDCVPQRNDA